MKVRTLFSLAALAVGLYPAFELLYKAFYAGLGIDPVKTLLHTTGFWALTLLVLTLSVTPLRKLTGYAQIFGMRKVFGRMAFFWASAHIVVFVWIDQFFDMTEIFKAVKMSSYVQAGLAAFLLMLPAALTSPDFVRRKIGFQKWKTVHKVVYFSAAFAALHFLLLVKKDISRPAVFIAIFAFLMILRLPPVSTRLEQWKIF